MEDYRFIDLEELDNEDKISDDIENYRNDDYCKAVEELTREHRY